MTNLAVSDDSRESADEVASDGAAAKPTEEAGEADWVPEQDYLALVCKRYTPAGCSLKASSTVTLSTAPSGHIAMWLANTVLSAIYLLHVLINAACFTCISGCTDKERHLPALTPRMLVAGIKPESL